MILTAKTYSKILGPLTLSLVACSGENTPSEAQISMFTGRLDTADSVVGLAVSDQGEVDAYICGGAANFATYSRWFIGSLTSGTAALETDGFRLDLAMQGQTITVSLTDADGTTHSTTAARVADGNHSGLYESNAESSCRWGVVVLDDGATEPEIHGTWCAPSTTNGSTDIYAQVTPVKPIDFSNGYLSVLVTTPAGEERFDVYRTNLNRSTP